MTQDIKEQDFIGYEVQRAIKIFEVTRETKVFYVIKTLLEIINRWKEVEIHVVKKYE